MLSNVYILSGECKVWSMPEGVTRKGAVCYAGSITVSPDVSNDATAVYLPGGALPDPSQ